MIKLALIVSAVCLSAIPAMAGASHLSEAFSDLSAVCSDQGLESREALL